jgi:hypothetical protein
MPELVFGAVVGLVLAGWAGLTGSGGAVLAALGAGVVYLGSCWMKPYRGCWWPWHDSKVRDRRGNYRLRVCWLCKGAPWRRVGARLIGRGKS